MFNDNLLVENSSSFNSSKVATNKNITDNISISNVLLNRKEAIKINKIKGNYSTIFFNKKAITKEIDILIDVTIKEINKLLEKLKVTKTSKILFVGLGNKNLACDRFGYLMIDKIIVGENTSKIYKDVEGLTNLNSAEFIKTLCYNYDIDLVIVFDSLKAENIDRLGKTIQLSTAGIYPGSGKSKLIKELSKKTIKCNILSIGVPFIINMKDVSNENPSLLITIDEVDEIVENISSILSIAINKIF